MDAMILHLFGGVYYSYLRHLYGGGHFDSYSTPSGPYKVSVTSKWIPKKGHFCTVWYPSEEGKEIGTTKALLKRYQFDFEGYKQTLMWMFGEGDLPPQIFLKPTEVVEIPVSVDARVASDFVEGKKQLIPVIYSHGQTGTALDNTVMYREMASHGCMVVSFDHLDRSCGYTVNEKTGEVVLFDTSIPFTCTEPVKLQLYTR